MSQRSAPLMSMVVVAVTVDRGRYSHAGDSDLSVLFLGSFTVTINIGFRHI